MRRFPLIVTAFAIVGCTASNVGRTTSNGGANGGSNGGATNGATGGSNGGASNGATGGSTGGVDPGSMDPNCGIQNFTLQKGLPPDLLIVLDRSGSMADAPPAGGGSKWDQITSAINSTVMTLQSQIKWGLEVFPSDNDCGVSANVDVPIGGNAGAAIASAIASHDANGSTPTTAALNTGAQYLTTVVDSNPKYMLLATDGEPNCASAMPAPGGACTCMAPLTLMGTNCCLGPACFPCTLVSGAGAGGDDTAGAEQAVTTAAMNGIHTFVVGVAADSTDDAVLNQMAQNGGEARAGATKYYPVGSQADLITTINTIAGQIISCSFALAMPPPNPDYVAVYIDTDQVPIDKTHMNGWDYGPGNGSIQFYGSYCAMLQAGSAMDVQAIYQCGPVT